MSTQNSARLTQNSTKFNYNEAYRRNFDKESLDCFWNGWTAYFCDAFFDPVDCIREKKGKSHSAFVLIPITSGVDNPSVLRNPQERSGFYFGTIHRLHRLYQKLNAHLQGTLEFCVRFNFESRKVIPEETGGRPDASPLLS